MSSDPIRAAVQEAIDWIDGATDSDDLAIRACQVVTALRAALTAPLEGEPSDEELLETYCDARRAFYFEAAEGESNQEDRRASAIAGLRAVLSHWGRPSAPPAPLEWEVGELVKFLDALAAQDLLTAAYTDKARRASTLLEQLSAAAPALVPVAVSERLPGDELCWWYEPDEDDDGSGYGGNWTLLRIRGGVSCYTHWLPAHALPLPAPQGGEAGK